MKKLIITIIVLLLISVSCKDLLIETVLNKDGSFSRSYEISYTSPKHKYNEDSLNGQTHILPYDSSWSKTKILDTTNKKATYLFSKSFSNADELQNIYETKEYQLKSTHPHIKYTSHYNGIKSTYSYQEKFNRIFLCAPPQEIFTPEEIKLIKSNNYNENKELKNKFNIWLGFGFIELVKQSIDSLSNKKLNLTTWEVEIKHTLKKLNARNEKDESDSIKFDFIDFDKLVKSIEKCTEENLDTATREALKKVLTKHIKTYSAVSINKLTFSVQFSGYLIKTNADSVIDNKAYWTFSPLSVGSELVMEIKSERINYSILSITFIVIVLVILNKIWKKQAKEVKD